MDKQIDVIVVGAGPIGLLLAIELKLGGAEVLVLERLSAPNLGIKAPSVGPLGAEAPERRGMGRQFAEAQDRTFAAMGPAGVAARARRSNSRGHFALFPLRADPQHEPERRIRMVNQPSLEAILGEQAAALDIEIRRGSRASSSRLRVSRSAGSPQPGRIMRPAPGWSGVTASAAPSASWPVSPFPARRQA